MQYLRLCPILSSSPANHYVFKKLMSTEAVGITTNTPLKSWEEIPGPSCLPLIGPLRHVLPGGSLSNLNGAELLKTLNVTYGPIVRFGGIFGFPPMIIIYDAESSAQILRGENKLPARPEFKSLEYYRHKHKKGVVPNKPTGLLTDHGEPWKKIRSMINPVMLQPKTIKLYAATLDEVSIDMVARLKSKRDKNNQIQAPFDREINFWALESIGVVALGCRIHCLDPNLPKDSPARRLIEIVHDLFEVNEVLDFKSNLWKIFATPTFKKAMKLYEEQEIIAKHFIDKTVKKPKTKNQSDDEKSVLEKLLEINEDLALLLAADLMIAGIDTTSMTIVATLYLLASNLEKQDKLRAEILSKEEKKPYLKACLKESMRMLPVVNGNFRATTKEHNILGYKIPSNAHVVLVHQDMSRMEEHFPRPNEFIPERWLLEKDDPLSYKNAHPFAYSPFGYGVRSCIGRRIAELEMETFLARMIETFQLEWFGPPIKVAATSNLNYIRGPFNFIFKDVA